MIALIIALQIGGIIDARTHVFTGFAIDSFFVPAHYLMYGAWLGILALISAYVAAQIRRGRTDQILPRGYSYSALGALLFGVAGVLDLIWHTLFGFELNLEILLSPAHLVLFSAFGLIYFGVLSHAIYEYQQRPPRHPASFRFALPLNIGIASLFVIVFWPTWYFDPLAADYASGGAIIAARSAYAFIDFGSPTAEIAGVAGILLTTAIMVPFAVVPLHRWRLPSGSLTFIFAWVFIQRAVILGVYAYLPAVFGAAFVCELIWARTRGGHERRLASPNAYRAIAFLLPFTLLSIYFATISIVLEGILWPPHIWLGVILMAALVGLSTSMALIPATGRAERTS
jgi:hypothetical protein